MERSRAFDAEALDHLGSLKTLSRRLAQNQSEADDLVQDAYLHAFRASHRFSAGTNLRAWLRRILTNLALNRHRDRKRYEARLAANEADVARAVGTTVSHQTSPEQLLLNKDIGRRLQTALESMPKTLRDAVWLRDVEELSYADMAKRLRVPLGTVMSRISRGRRLLLERWIEDDGAGSSL